MNLATVGGNRFFSSPTFASCGLPIGARGCCAHRMQSIRWYIGRIPAHTQTDTFTAVRVAIYFLFCRVFFFKDFARRSSAFGARTQPHAADTVHAASQLKRIRRCNGVGQCDAFVSEFSSRPMRLISLRIIQPEPPVRRAIYSVCPPLPKKRR